MFLSIQILNVIITLIKKNYSIYLNLNIIWVYDPCSYLGIQCKFYYNNCIKIIKMGM